MDGRRIIELVEAAQQDAAGEPVNMHEFAARVAEAQREETALYFENLGFGDIAAKVRAT